MSDEIPGQALNDGAPLHPEPQPPIDGKYGTVSVQLKKFHPGEPVFILRATDKLAPAAVEQYAALCQRDGCEEAHVIACYQHANRIREWQAAHPELVKLPD